ncbi:hypothetical protein BGX28_007521, partial [Mortierella sp. GBA30]
MAASRNRGHHESNGMPGSRVHCVRVRRVMGRKHQLQRREYRFASYESTTASIEEMYHHAKQANMMCSSSSSRSESQESCSAAMQTTSGHRRHNLARDRRQVPVQLSERYRDGLCNMLLGGGAVGGASPFATGYSTFSHDQLQDGPLLLRLPPAVERTDMI